MALLATDHNFDSRIAIGLLRRKPDLDIVPIRDVGLASAPDPVVVEWAAAVRRVLLTHDRATLLAIVHQRVARGEPMSGVIAVNDQSPIGLVIDDLLLLVECTPDGEWAGQVFFVPL